MFPRSARSVRTSTHLKGAAMHRIIAETFGALT
jgi:hypothetical protein